MQPPWNSTLPHWTKIGSPSVTEKVDHAGCVENRNANCWSVCATNTDINDGYIYRIDSTIGYQNISMTYTVDPWSMQANGESCTLWYSIDNQNDNWVQFAGPWNSNHHIEDNTTYLPIDSWNNIGVGIKILAVGGTGECC